MSEALRFQEHKRLLPLALCQIVGWGTAYYSISTLIDPIQSDLGWTNQQIIAPFSGALLASGVASTFIGAAIARLGPRVISIAGSVGMALCFLSLAQTCGYVHYFITWIVIGLLMEATFFQPVFASFAKEGEIEAKRSIAMLTLFTGLSGSIAVVATAFLADTIGWRETAMVFSALQLANALGYASILPMGDAVTTPEHSRRVSDGRVKDVVGKYEFWLMAAIFSSVAFMSAGLTVNMVDLVTVDGLSRSVGIGLISLSGPIQFAVRAVLSLAVVHINVRSVGLLAFGSQAAGLFIVGLTGFSYTAGLIFVILLGTSAGLTVFINAALIRSIFGASDFARAQGALSAPTIVARSMGPVGLAALLDAGVGFKSQLLAMGCLTLAVMLAFMLLASRTTKTGG